MGSTFWEGAMLFRGLGSTCSALVHITCLVFSMITRAESTVTRAESMSPRAMLFRGLGRTCSLLVHTTCLVFSTVTRAASTVTRAVSE